MRKGKSDRRLVHGRVEPTTQATCRWSAPTQLLHQYLRFGVVGLSALGTHILVFAGLIEFGRFNPMLANLLGFGVAWGISFLGHFHWSFQTSAGSASAANSLRTPLVRFMIVAFVGLSLNSLAVQSVTGWLDLHYFYAVVVMATIVPVIVFVLSKYWAFAHA